MRCSGDLVRSPYCSLATSSGHPVSIPHSSQTVHTAACAAACAVLCGGTQELPQPLCSWRRVTAARQHGTRTARSSAVAACPSSAPSSQPPSPTLLHSASCAVLCATSLDSSPWELSLLEGPPGHLGATSPPTRARSPRRPAHACTSPHTALLWYNRWFFHNVGKGQRVSGCRGAREHLWRKATTPTSSRRQQQTTTSAKSGCGMTR